MKEFEHFYKTSDINYNDKLDRLKYEYINEYGYNLDCNKRTIMDLEKYIETKNNRVNYIDINVKR